MNMIWKVLRHAFSAVIILNLCLFYLAAQNPPAKGKMRGTVTITGCLQKGDEAGEFSITGEDGKVYGLRSKSLSLADHLGHKVTVTGKTKPEGRGEKEKGSPEVADVNVTDLKMISTSCP